METTGGWGTPRVFWGQRAGSACGTHGVNKMSWSLRQGRQVEVKLGKSDVTRYMQMGTPRCLDVRRLNAQRALLGLGAEKAGLGGNRAHSLSWAAAGHPACSPPLRIHYRFGLGWAECLDPHDDWREGLALASCFAWQGHLSCSGPCVYVCIWGETASAKGMMACHSQGKAVSGPGDPGTCTSWFWSPSSSVSSCG